MKKLSALALKAAISLALLSITIAQVDLGILGDRLARIDAGWLAASFIVLMLQAYFVSMRWQVIAVRCEVPLSVWASFRFTLISVLFNQALPSTMGGDAARIWLLVRDGANLARSTYSVVIDRAVGVLFLALLVLVCLPWSFELIQNPAGRAALLLIGIGCFAGPMAFAALGMRRWPLLERWAVTRHVADAARFASRLFREAYSAVSVIVLSVGVHLLTITSAWMAAVGVGVPLPFSYALLLVLPVLMISMIPISIAGWGLREGAMVMAFAYAGLPESDGLLVSVLLGLLMFAVGIAGGIVWLIGSKGAPREVPEESGQTP